MKNIKSYFLNNKKSLLILIVIIFLIIISVLAVIVSSLNKTEYQEIETAIKRQSISSTKLELQNILLQDGDWYLIKVHAKNVTTEDAMEILFRENDVFTIIAGPQTSFDIDALAKSNIPDSIIDYLFGDNLPIVIGTSILNKYYTPDYVNKLCDIFKRYYEQQGMNVKKITIIDDSFAETYSGTAMAQNLTIITEFQITANNDSTVSNVRITIPFIGDMICEIENDADNTSYTEKL